jgi:hypothetical protein
MEQLVNLEFLAIDGEGEIFETLDFSPLASLTKLENISFRNGILRKCSFAWVEHLAYTKRLRIEDGGDNLATIDFTPLASLTRLEEINFRGSITRLPDLTKLKNIHSLVISAADLENLDGIGAPNAKSIRINSNKIGSFAPLNNLMYLEELKIWSKNKRTYKIADMANLPSLKSIELDMVNAKIDLQGIEKMQMLKDISIWYSEPFNIEGIGKLKNIERLNLNIISPEPSLEFLRDMQNLLTLALLADYNRKGFNNSSEAYQVLDMRPLATAKNLKRLDCYGFIIKNISALDGLETLSTDEYPGIGFVSLLYSRLYDETEKSRHSLVFEVGSKE